MSEPPALYPKLDPSTYSLPPTPPVGIQHSRMQNSPVFVQPRVPMPVAPIQYQQQAYYKQSPQNFPSTQNYGYAPSIPYPPNNYYPQTPSYPIPQNYQSQQYVSNSPTHSNNPYPPQVSPSHSSSVNPHQSNIPSQQYSNQYPPQSQQYSQSSNLYNFSGYQNGTPTYPNYYPSNPPPNHYVSNSQPQQQPHTTNNHVYQQPNQNYQTQQQQQHATNQSHSNNNNNNSNNNSVNSSASSASNFSLFSNPNYIQSSSNSSHSNQKIESYSSNAFSNPSIFPDLHDSGKDQEENESEEIQEEEVEEEVVETSDNHQQRKLIRAVQRCERTLNRLISAMNKRNKSASISAHEKLKTQVEEIKQIAQHGTLHEVNSFLHQVKKATDYFENEFQVVIQQINEEREQNLAQYRKAIKDLQQDVAQASKLLDKSLQGGEKTAIQIIQEVKKESQQQ